MKRKRLLSLIVCALVLFTLVFSISFIAVKSHHDCIGDGCPICRQIEACVGNLRAVGTAVIVSAFISAFSVITVDVCRKPHGTAFFRTPVSLKVKPTN